EREAKIRRLVDANIIGIIIWELGGRILEANDAFLRIVGYDREDLAPDGALVDVEDTGVGIDPTTMNRILTHFSRPSPTALVWDCQFAFPLSRPMAVAFGRRQMSLAAVYFISPCPRQSMACQMIVPSDDANATVVVIDDDPEVREALQGLLQTVGL